MRNFIFRKLSTCIIFVLTFACMPANGIAGDFKGTVKDEANHPVYGAVVTLFALPDSAMLGNALTGADGKFEIMATKKQGLDYIYELSCIGFKKEFIAVSGNDMALVLKESVSELKGVTVTSQSFKREPGKFIYTPSGIDLVAGGCYNMLKYMPMLTVEGNSIGILGKGSATIFINGRKPIMSGNMVMDYLRSLPTKNLIRIEIITNPDVSNKATELAGGILNVVIKRPEDGVNGYAMLDANYATERLSPTASTNLSYAKGRLHASAYIYANMYNTSENTSTLYNYKDINTISDNLNKKDNSSYGGGMVLNMAYDINEKSMFGFSGSISMNETDNENYSENKYMQAGNINRVVETFGNTTVPIKNPVYGLNAYYNIKTDDKGSNLDITAGFNTSKNIVERDYRMMDGNSATKQYEQNSSNDNYGLELKANYLLALKGKGTLRFGYELNHSNIDDDFRHLDFVNATWTDVASLSNRFKYKETVNAGFLSYNRRWSKKFSLNAGVRVENTHTEGEQIATGEHFTNDYVDVIPNMTLDFNIVENKHNLTLQASRYLSRPFYSKLNPYKVWFSESEYKVGNMYQTPSIGNTVGLIYMLMNSYIFGVNYTHMQNELLDYRTVVGDGLVEWSTANTGHYNFVQIYSNINKRFFNGVWRVNGQLSFLHEHNTGAVGLTDVGYTNNRWTLRFANTVALNKKRDFTGNITYTYHSPMKMALRDIKEKHMLFLTLTKSFAKHNAMLSLDIANPTNFRNNTSFENDLYSYKTDIHTNQITVQMRFIKSFGNNKVRGANDRSSSKHRNRMQ